MVHRSPRLRGAALAALALTLAGSPAFASGRHHRHRRVEAAAARPAAVAPAKPAPPVVVSPPSPPAASPLAPESVPNKAPTIPEQMPGASSPR